LGKAQLGTVLAVLELGLLCHTVLFELLKPSDLLLLEPVQLTRDVTRTPLKRKGNSCSFSTSPDNLVLGPGTPKPGLELYRLVAVGVGLLGQLVGLVYVLVYTVLRVGQVVALALATAVTPVYR
jgi:hypothetical protein